MKTLPNALPVGEAIWCVEELGEPEGLTVFDRTILVRWRGRPENERINTLLHELLHAAWPDGFVSDGDEERMVSHLASNLTPTLRALLRLKE